MDVDVLLAAALFLVLVGATVAWVAAFYDSMVWHADAVGRQANWLEAVHPVLGD